MKISVPENVGGQDLRLLPVTNPLYEATISDAFLGKSQSGNPKLTVRYTVTSEYTGPEAKEKDFESTIGAPVIETFSLQEQAIWKLNDLFKKVTGDRIPAEEYDEEEFLNMIKKAIVGTKVTLLLKHGTSNKGEKRLEVDKLEVASGSKLGGKTTGRSRR